MKKIVTIFSLFMLSLTVLLACKTTKNLTVTLSAPETYTVSTYGDHTLNLVNDSNEVVAQLQIMPALLDTESNGLLTYQNESLVIYLKINAVWVENENYDQSSIGLKCNGQTLSFVQDWDYLDSYEQQYRLQTGTANLTFEILGLE